MCCDAKWSGCYALKGIISVLPECIGVGCSINSTFTTHRPPVILHAEFPLRPDSGHSVVWSGQ